MVSRGAGFKDKLLAEKEAERVIRIVDAEMELLGSVAERKWLGNDDPRKVMCAAMVKRRTAVKNDWLGQPTADGPSCGHEAVADPHSEGSERPKILKKYEKIFYFKA